MSGSNAQVTIALDLRRFEEAMRAVADAAAALARAAFAFHSLSTSQRRLLLSPSCDSHHLYDNECHRCLNALAGLTQEDAA